MRVGPQQLLSVLIIVILIFGPTQIPKLSKMFGKSMKKFKEGMAEDEDEEEEVVEKKAKKKSQKSADVKAADEDEDD